MKVLLVSAVVVLVASVAFASWSAAHPPSTPEGAPAPEPLLSATRPEAASSVRGPVLAREAVRVARLATASPGPSRLAGRVALPPGFGAQGVRLRVVWLGEVEPATEGAGAPASEEDEGLGLTLEGEGEEVAEFEVEASGAFAYEGAAGRYRLEARAPGLVPTRLEELVLAPGESVEGLWVAFAEGLGVGGRVVAGGRPVEGASVQLMGQGYRLTTATDEAGAFRFEGLEAGRYEVEALHVEEGRQSSEVEAGQQVVLEMAPPTRLRGRVVDGEGRPVAGARIFAEPSRPWRYPDEAPGVEAHTVEVRAEGGGCTPLPECRQVAVTDSGGRFELPVPRGMAWHVGAALGRQRALALEVLVEADAEAEEGGDAVELTLLPTGQARVKVEGRSGEPVRLVSEASFASAEALTDARGEALLEVWPGARARIQSEAEWKFLGEAPSEVRPRIFRCGTVYVPPEVPEP